MSQAQVSGTVFRDFNANGVQNNTATFKETGVQGVTVKAFNAAGVQVGGDKTTDASGAYSFTGLTLPVRIEFSGLAAGDFPGAQGSGSGTSVQFVTANSSSVNYGINYPSDYCQDAPPLFVPCYVNGDPTLGGTAATNDALVSVPYSASGSAPAPTKLAPASAVGSVWGLTYHRNSKRLLTAAFLKRHAGLLGAGLAAFSAPTRPPRLRLCTLIWKARLSTSTWGKVCWGQERCPLVPPRAVTTPMLSMPLAKWVWVV